MLVRCNEWCYETKTTPVAHFLLLPMASGPDFDPFSCNPFEESVKKAQLWTRQNSEAWTSSPGMAEYDKLVDRWTESDTIRTVAHGLATAPLSDPDHDLYTSAMRSLNLNQVKLPPVESAGDYNYRNYQRVQQQHQHQQWQPVSHFVRESADQFAGQNCRSAMQNNSHQQHQASFNQQRQPAHFIRQPLLVPHGYDNRFRQQTSANMSDPLIDLGSPPLRQIRGNALNQSPIDLSYDLSYQLDRCQEQMKLMERERRKGELALSQLFPGKKVTGNNSIPVPKLPPKPTRVDRLIVDQIKEHAKIFTLIALMEQMSGDLSDEILSKIQAWLMTLRALQNARTEEQVAAAGTDSFTRREASAYAVSLAVKELCSATRTARTTFWCAFITVVFRESANRQSVAAAAISSPQSPAATAVAEEALTPRGEPVIPVLLMPAPHSTD